MKPPIAPAPWFVYMLECRGGRIYTGVTPDLAARLAKHRAGKGGSFTRSFPPRRMLAALRCASRGEALSTEHALKRLAPSAKLAWARQHPHVIPAKAGIQKTGSPRPRGRLNPSAVRETRRPPPRAGARSRSS